MPTKEDTLVSLGDLAKELGFNKSKLALYAQYGILRRFATVGRSGIYQREESLKRIKEAETLSKQGFKLSQMKDEIA
jgi:DNA-binding transcriptional MerR regulator